MGLGLVMDSGRVESDLILIDNLESEYLLFEKAALLKEQGLSDHVLIPVQASRRNPSTANLVSREIVEVMLKVSGISSAEILPIRHVEPITLNAAVQIRDKLQTTLGIRSVQIVTSGFRSRRTCQVYSKVLGEAGIRVYCVPVWGGHRLDNWTATWHGIQEVWLQHVKLLYYQLFVMRK